jgi:hypothetical protein
VPSKPAPLASGIGRPPKHAGRLLSRVVRKNQLDRRTGVSKLLERVADDLATDRGGWANVGAAEEIAIRRAAFLTVLCGSIEAWCLGQGDVIVDGELLGPLKKGLATHQANLIRTLAALGFRADRAGKQPSLAEYIAAGTEQHDYAEAKPRGQAGGAESGKPECGGGCTDCQSGEPGNATQPEAPAGGEDAA